MHEPIVRGIVRAHGGVLQTHDVPGMSGSAYVLEVPIGSGAGAMAAPAAPGGAELALPEQASGTSGRRRARRSSVDAFLESEVPGPDDSSGGGEAAVPTGRRRRRAGDESATAVEAGGEGTSGGTGRRRGRAADGDESGSEGVSEGAVMTAAEHAAGTAASGTGLGGTVSPRGVPLGGERQALLTALPASGSADDSDGPDGPGDSGGEDGQPTGRRRRALAAAAERAAAQEAGARTVFALPLPTPIGHRMCRRPRLRRRRGSGRAGSASRWCSGWASR